jgi:putative polymerase
MAIALVIGAIVFNAALCFVNAHVAPIRSSYVVGSEAVIIAIAIFACRRTIEPKDALIIATVGLYTALLVFLRSGISPGEGFNLKISRDFLVPVIFLLLGKAVSDIRVADTLVYLATGLVLVFALFEFFNLDAFLNVFKVTAYYVARGTLDDSTLQWANGLMASGMRPPDQGRNLLPFLGNHRISSLFLEPIGLGNFGSIVALWAIARSTMERRLRFWSIAAGLFLIVLSDGRFNAAFLGIGLLILLSSPRITTPLVLVMPFVFMLGLWLAAANAPAEVWPFRLGLSLNDRLLYSGRVLLDFDLLHLLGLKPSRAPTADAGYAYVISNVGLIGFTAFWFWILSLGGRNRYFYAFRNANAAWFAMLLCISTSQFTIKTAALQWFLMGALSVASEGAHRLPQSRGRFLAQLKHEHRPAG